MSLVSNSRGSTANVAQNRAKLSRMLQLHGYSACHEALVLLEDHFTNSTKYESLEDFISQLHRTITFHTTTNSSVIDPDLAYLAIRYMSDVATQQLVANDGDETDAPNQRELPIKIKNVQYEPSDKLVKSNQNSTNDKNANEFSIHYNFLYKRLSSLPIFQDNFQLMKLATLTGSSQPSIRCICFGLLIKDISKIDGYMLIDSTGRVPVRITPDTTFRNRLAYVNCIVLVEGVYVNPDDILFAANIGLPPILLDPLENKSLICQEDKLVVVLKELYLDDEDICEALDMLFTGYNSMEDPPMLFILIGDFTREPCETISLFTKHMKKLVRILRQCDNLKDCHFVFVPGLRDTSYIEDSNSFMNNNSKMPKQPLTWEQLPKNLLNMSNFHNIHAATNPAHIYIGDRIISVVAHSYIKELRKYLLHDLSDHREELFETVKQIILSNGHLTAGISKSFPSSMNLWHKPDLLILADTEAFGNRYDYSKSSSNDTSFATIPSFSRQSNQFKVYYLATGEIEDSQVSSDAYQDIEENDGDNCIQLDSEQERTDSG